jgi:hypothetical protein
MGGKARKSSSSKAASKQRNSTMKDDGGGGIVDERFIAAITRPQFQKAKRRGGGGRIADAVDDGDGGGDGTLMTRAGGGGGMDDALLDSVGGLGESLTQAIRSDDRFRAALIDSEKFGCVPDMDKYGRKSATTKKKEKEKTKTWNDRSGGDDDNYDHDDEEEDGDADEGSKLVKNKSEKHDNLGVDNNSIEARIAYLNALSRGDISGSSSSDDSSVEGGNNDDHDDDDDDDDDISTSSSKDNIRGTSGIFDPSHKSLFPGGDDSNQGVLDDETDEPSPYLCILNLNWEHIRAVDVFAMLHSFCPPGTLQLVEVYPSDFGRERMEKERVEGPPAGIWKNRGVEKEKKLQDEVDEEEDESSQSSSDGVSSDEVSEKNSTANNSDDGPTNNSNDDSEYDDDDDEDVLDLNDATSKLYAHFPPQSTVTKNSKLQHDQEEEEGFDVEKLREYEASKLRYYFAIATFSTYAAASQVYENVDGMEMEDSAAEIDVRVLPKDQYASTIQDRAVRDTCDRIPAKYIPPENAVATALKQSRVTCSWERGDADRERMLTRYGMGKEAWEALATGEDIKFYLATSDNSSCSSGDGGGNSDDESEVEGGVKSSAKEATRTKKGSSTRKMLGLATSDSEDENDGTEKLLLVGEDSTDDDSDGNSSDEHSIPMCQTKSELKSTAATVAIKALNHSKEVTFVPGKQNLDEKIRAKVKQSVNCEAAVDVEHRKEEQLSPFQKYLQKRKEKKKERRQASRMARRNNGDKYVDNGDDVDDDDDDMYRVDPEFGSAQFSDDESSDGDAGDNKHDDEFFIDNSSRTSKPATKRGGSNAATSSREELELLLAGDDGSFIEMTFMRCFCVSMLLTLISAFIDRR